MSKRTKAIAVAMDAKDVTPVEVPAQAKVKIRRRKRRRSSGALLAHRTLLEIKAKERQFLREVSQMLTEALGFPVRVSHVKQPMTPRMNKFARMSKAQARQQIMDAFAPLTLNDKLPI